MAKKLGILGAIDVKAVTGGLLGNKERMAKLLTVDRMIMMTVVGIANGYTIKEGKDGREPSILLSGSFKATDYESGKVFRAGRCYLPKMASSLIAGMFSKETSEIQFGFVISARYDADSITQYVYEVESLMEPSESDAVELLEKSFGSLALLPADIKVDESTPQLSAVPTTPEPVKEVIADLVPEKKQAKK